MKKAILAISFGTGHDDTREKTIGAVENALRAAVCDQYDLENKASRGTESIPVIRAFTSRRIIQGLRQRGIVVLTVEEAFGRLLERGYEEVVVQPTVIIPGEEYENLRELVGRQESRFQAVRMGEPLLSNREDERRLSEIMSALYPLDEGEALILTGHGSGSAAGQIYHDLNDLFRLSLSGPECGIYVGTVQGEPSLERILEELRRKNCRKVILAPLMLTAGGHAVHDMAGPSPDSWKSRLESEGYPVRAVLKGLGEYEEIREMYVEKLRKIL